MSIEKLKKNDSIALVCTGTPSETEKDAQLSKNYLWNNYEIKACYQHDTFRVLPAIERARIFFQYLQDDRLKMIWSLRGGEGTADIIPYLEQKAGLIRAFTPKLLMGFSDFTPIINYFQQRFNWPTIHGPGARQLVHRMINKTSEKVTLDWLQARTQQIELTDLKPLNIAAHENRIIRAPIVGGNLSLVHISVNDIWELDVANKILLLEEVNEKPHKVTRTLKHLNRIGFFNGVKAILFAGFDLAENLHSDIKRSMQNVLKQFAQEIVCPVLFTDLIGHGENNVLLPFYVDTELHLGHKPRLVIKGRPIFS